MLAAVSASAAPAAAKEGVRATLERPVRLDAAPGKTLSVAWRLTDEEGRRFGASGIYLRVEPCRGGPRTVAATTKPNGSYVARVVVPRGKIRRLVVGLEGWRITPGRTERADAFFAFDPPLVRRC